MTDEEFFKHLRDALTHLYKPQLLRQNPLAALFGVAGRVDAPVALRRILIEAIASFEPSFNEPSDSQDWQIYGPLAYRYVEQLRQQEVANQLGFSVRHLRRKEHTAIEALAGYLWRKHNMGTYPSMSSVAKSAAPESAVNTELAWLGDYHQNGLTDLNATLPGVLAIAQGLADQQHLNITTNIPENLPAVAVDHIVMRQILLNLFDLAVHYTGEDAVYAVFFSVQILERMVTLIIRTRMVDPMPEQSDYLSDILLLNDDKQKAKLDMARRLAGASEASDIQLSFLVNTSGFDVMLSLHAQEWIPVLVVDDSNDTFQLLRRYAAGTRYRLISVRQPSKVLKLVETLRPRMIVLDVMMPGIDGWEVLSRLKQNQHTADIPVLVCTILPQEELAHFLGASAFLSKPVRRQDFLAALDAQME
ncbi:MAG: response regulator [Anaerolineae bacterium]|nr:response regulator [Anaerolineae bacterium]